MDDDAVRPPLHPERAGEDPLAGRVLVGHEIRRDGRLIGRIELLADGRLLGRDTLGTPVGLYLPTLGLTRDASGRLVGEGNHLVALLVEAEIRGG